MMERRHVLMVRLGAMGDVIHCLPAAATLKQGIQRAHLTWVVEARWAVPRWPTQWYGRGLSHALEVH